MVTGGLLLERSLPHAEVHVLENVGHEVVVEAPGQSLTLLRQFLGSDGIITGAAIR